MFSGFLGVPRRADAGALGVCAPDSRHQGLICAYEPEAALTGLQAEGCEDERPGEAVRSHGPVR